MDDAYFFIGLFAFIFIIWVTAGGPSKPLSFAGPFLTTNIASNGISYKGSGIPSTPAVDFSLTRNGYSKTQRFNSISQQVNNISTKVNSLSKKVSRTVAFGPPSPYRGKVFMYHYVSNPGTSNPNKEHLTLRVATNVQSSIDISGWKIKSGATGVAASIPLGTKVPRSGIINPIQPIVLQPGDMAIISSGRSPIGASFLENTCTGYFTQYQSFSPTLPRVCPIPYNELKKFYGQNYIRDSRCINYVRTINRCTTSITPPVGVTSACAAFLVNHLNYNGCVSAHENDSNFKETTWRVYLGRNKSMWRKRYEVVKLLDSNGKTVDMFSY